MIFIYNHIFNLQKRVNISYKDWPDSSLCSCDNFLYVTFLFWFSTLDDNAYVQMLNSLMLHGNKNFAEEKQILRNVNIQERDGASFKSLEMLKETVI